MGATAYNKLLRYTTVPSYTQDKPLTLCFDTCHATDQDPAGTYCGGVEWERTYRTARFYVGFHRATLNRAPARSGKWDTNRQRWVNALGGKVTHGQTKPDCKHHRCTPLCLRITPNQAKSSWVRVGEGNYEAEVSMGVHVPGARDPTGRIRFLMKGNWEKPTEHLVHTTFWKEMGTTVEVPAVTKNLFVDLAERVALSLSVTNCYVCAGTKMGEQWPWEAREVDYVNISRSPNLTWTDQQRPTQWALQNSIIGSRCFIRPAGQKYNISTGTLACEAGMVCNTTRKWMDFNHAGAKILIISLPRRVYMISGRTPAGSPALGRLQTTCTGFVGQPPMSVCLQLGQEPACWAQLNPAFSSYP
ncbi:endogenous retrovirus group 3 member 1 Env polyprotein-like [Hemicordylus capensis]|uniref:endogenous retrovirus group 3 member 1 Env polyprotein-like n=1 Tax=Hemicordylus capensis TaxID=884348 RepID=UPI002302AB7E|nr:endogenous retrovirus group 3 member 1 Env polyprotein-like [Hemicordylus capensis]